MRHPLLRLAALLVLPSCAAVKTRVTQPTRVVLVHGFLENGNTFKPLATRLEARGVEVHTAKLIPSDGRGGLERLAANLKKDIDKTFGPDQPISIVSFSMGGLVSRYYLQNLGGARRCETLITISSPHQGTEAAWLYPTKGASEMRPHSKFLNNLHATEGNLGNMKLVSYRTPLDLVIVPSKNSIWPRAENLSYPVALHPLMLTSGPVLDDIEKRLTKGAPASAGPKRHSLQ